MKTVGASIAAPTAETCTTRRVPAAAQACHSRLAAQPGVIGISCTAAPVSTPAAGGWPWPWLVQLGQDRGGFYSFDVLENLVGLDITSADRIEERWQDLAEGDVVRLAPQAELRVAVLDAPRALVLRGKYLSGGE